MVTNVLHYIAHSMWRYCEVPTSLYTTSTGWSSTKLHVESVKTAVKLEEWELRAHRSSTRKLVTDGLLLYYPVPVISVTYPVSLGIRAYRYANYTCACVSTTTYCPPLHPSAQELGTLSGGLPENRPWWKPLLVCVNNCREYKAGVVVCHTSTGCKYGHDIEIWCNFGNKMSHQWHVDN